MRTNNILKSDTFKYPTSEERRKISKITQKIDQFNIKYKSATIGIFEDSPFDAAIRNEDLYWWCNCINNRIAKLTETFVYVQVHYLREQERNDKESKNLHTDKILLDYFIEIFYYYYFSARDVLGQLINIFYDLKIEEEKLYINEAFVKVIPSNEIKNALSDFLNNTKDSYNIRNSFNHRFTPNHQDFRAKTNIIKIDNTISFFSAQEIKVETFLIDIENLMRHFSTLMNKLIKEIDNNCSEN